MLTYDQKKNLDTLNLSYDFEVEILDENLFTDFLKVAKKRYFDDTSFVPSERANEIKRMFSQAFIDSLDSIKFKKLSLTRLLFDPTKIMVEIQKQLKEALDKEYKNEAGTDIFKFVKKDVDYKPNTSVFSECFQILQKLELWIKDHIRKIILHTYNINTQQADLGSTKNFIKKFTDLFLEIFQTHKSFFPKLTLDSMNNNSKFFKIGAQVMKEIKKQSSGKDDVIIDIENLFVIDTKEDLNDINATPKEISKAEVELLANKVSLGYVMTTVKLFIRTYKLSVNTSEMLTLQGVFKNAYKYLLMKHGNVKSFNKSEIVKRMADQYGVEEPEVETVSTDADTAE